MEISDISFYTNLVSLWTHALLLISVVAGLLIHYSYFWKYRMALGALLTCLIGASTGLLFVSGISWWVIGLITLIQAYRLFSILRVVQNRVNEKSLRNKSLRSELFLDIFLLIILILEQLSFFSTLSTSTLLLLSASLQLIIATVFLLHAKNMYRFTDIAVNSSKIADEKLPSLSVCVPARNETEELTDCIRTILKSDYPKLEVIVLDDCSQDNTSDIIRTFAHHGVRFIAGKIPPNSWLAKNFAYQQLLDEAEGKYVVFCGTDVRFEIESLRKLVITLQANDKAMISVLPTRTDVHSGNFLLQPMRYWREIAIPKIFDNTPSVLSTCWIARRDFLNDIGGFTAHKKTIRPERIISREAVKKLSYRFVRSSSGLGISSVKTFRAQWDTAKRTRYPEHKNRPENIMLSSMLLFFTMLGAPLLVLLGIFSNNYLPAALSLVTMLFLLLTHYYVALVTGSQRKFSKTILFPLSVIMEIMVSNYSMWAYEFSEVLWKGRNVCLPVLQAIPRLPKIEKQPTINQNNSE